MFVSKCLIDLINIIDDRRNITDFSITLHEGKNRQIRRMFAHFELPVQKLHRYAIGPIKIDSLNHGEYRSLSPKEVTLLLNTAKGVV